MSIDGVDEKRINNELTIFFINHLSEQLKNIIRSQFQGIWSGFAEVDCAPDYYTYKMTLSSFLDRYNPKTDETKKGMIGELLAHILLNNQENGLTSLSILKNKEEKSIKKGFDIIYCDLKVRKIWYSEVKSGRRESGNETSDEYNNILLKRARSGMQTMIAEKRDSLWESALIDVSLVLNDSNGKIDMKRLLSKDSPRQLGNNKKNVILISVLYHPLSESISETKIRDFQENSKSIEEFDGMLICSIQKSTFEAIESFLSEELKNEQ